MSLTAIYLQHRTQFLERHTSTAIQFLKMRQPDNVEELADLERIWRVECESLHVAFLNGNRAFFDKREAEIAQRTEGDHWDAQ